MVSNTDLVGAVAQSLDEMDTGWSLSKDSGGNLLGLKFCKVPTSESFILGLYLLHGRYWVRTNSWISFEDAADLSMAVQGFLDNIESHNQEQQKSLVGELFKQWLN